MITTKKFGNSNFLKFYFLMTVAGHLNPVFSDAETVVTDETTTDENTSPICNNRIFTENGNCSLKFQEEYDGYRINLNFTEETSIINLTLSIHPRSDDINVANNDHSSGVSFTVHFYETTRHSNGTEEDVLLKKWVENPQNAPIEKSYLSRSSRLCIFVTSIGNWSQYDIVFSFEEIQYSLWEDGGNIFTASGKREYEYRPNSVTLYRFLEESSSSKWKSVEITFENLNISKEMGDYLLIGAGVEVLEDFPPPLYVMEVTANSTFYVGHPSAHVAFVSGPVEKLNKGYTISWNREAAKEKPATTVDPLGMLNSSLICFYNFSEAMEEFKKNGEEQFESFRKVFAKSVIDFVKSDKMQVTDARKRIVDSLDETSVALVGHPTKPKDSDALSRLVQVVHKGKSIFTWEELQWIIETFEQNNTTKLSLGYKVGRCPQDKNERYKEKWSFIMYAMVPVFGLCVLFIWAWKQNIFSQKCTSEKKMDPSFCPSPRENAEPNDYEMTTIPKIRLIDDNCRRMTLLPGSSQEEEEREDVTVVEINAIPSTSRVSDTLTRFLTSRRSKQRPSLQSLRERNKEDNELSDIGKAEGTQSEHLYDSVNSTKVMFSVNETKL